MKSISKAASTNIDELVTAAREASQILDGKINEYNLATTDLKAEIASAVTNYNEAVTAITEAYRELGEIARSYHDERSEKWQDGEKGQAYGEWADQLETFEMDQIELEVPEDLELPVEIPNFDDLDVPPDTPWD